MTEWSGIGRWTQTKHNSWPVLTSYDPGLRNPPHKDIDNEFAFAKLLERMFFKSEHFLTEVLLNLTTFFLFWQGVD